MMSTELTPDENDDRVVSAELEYKGYLQKKNSKGYFQQRYFETDGSALKYWTDFDMHEKGLECSSSYDVKDISSIERMQNRVIILQFSSKKFTVELRAPTEEQQILLFEILNAKRALFCVSELLLELDSGVEFQTVSFSTLMKLNERDQCTWIISRLDDYFESAADEARTSMVGLAKPHLS